MTTRFMVTISGTMVDTFATLQEAENKVNEIKSKCAWEVDVDIKEYQISC